MMEVKQSDFYNPMSPNDLNDYVEQVIGEIYGNSEFRKVVRLRQEPYKTFIEELRPFNDYCQYKYGKRQDVTCCLVENDEYDALIEGSELRHVIEITWPIDGQYIHNLSIQLNENGITDFEVHDYNDVSKHESNIERVLEIDRKKSTKDYEWPGESTLLIVFTTDVFRSDNPKHMELLDNLIEELRKIEFRVKNVILLLKNGLSYNFVDIKCPA